MIQPIKRLGQNFLKDPNTIRRIVGSLHANSEDRVVEIGPGMGALTGLLAEKYADFSAIELDQRAVDYLRDELPNVRVDQGDVLKVDWAARAGGATESLVSVIGNLPYYITSQILFGLLDASGSIREAVIMMQYEVAARLVAVPRTKDYGILSVVVQLACKPQILFPVSSNVFYPKPDVRSAMVRLEFPKTAPEHGVNPAWLRKIVRSAFNQRRKTLRNSLSAITGESGKELPDSVKGRRAEELTPNEFVDLALYLQGD